MEKKVLNYLYLIIICISMILLTRSSQTIFDPMYWLLYLTQKMFPIIHLETHIKCICDDKNVHFFSFNSSNSVATLIDISDAVPAHWEIFSKSYYVKPKSDCIYHFPIVLKQKTDVRLLFQINLYMVNTISDFGLIR